MKKSLYGSTALIAATALVAAGTMVATPAIAEEGVQLGLGGYYNTFFWVGDYSESSNDTRRMTETGLFADGEMHFKGSTTLDNGITFGVQVELEAFQSNDQIDENYAFVEGSFGRLVVGGENTAGLHDAVCGTERRHADQLRLDHLLRAAAAWCDDGL